LELQGSLRTGRQDNKIDHQSSLIHNPKHVFKVLTHNIKEFNKTQARKENLATHEINKKESCKLPIHQGWP
ncbi:hypothetical protein LINPERPRIM_LOCUS37622, partial [Linum perenne]